VSLFSPALRAATEDVNLKVDNERLNFTAVSGLEGHIGNHFCCKISPAHLRIARIQPLQDVIFALVDGHTGAIVVIGSGIGVEP
jgi:hypothetical protein